MRSTLIFVIAMLCSCTEQQDKELYIGDLYFSGLRLGSFYNLEDSIGLKIERTMDTSRMDMADSASRNLIRLYHKLKAAKLLYKPFVDLRLSDSTFVKLYLDSADYDRIRKYKRKYLLDNQKKVMVWARTEEIGAVDFRLRYCTELVDVQEVDGQTFPKKQGKFKIEDYN